MLSNVEEKTYEFGMLRALGFEKKSLLLMLLQESLIFSLPGLGFGFLFSYLTNSVVGMSIFDSTQLIDTYDYKSTNLTLGFLLGIFIPIISNIFPLRRALSQSLRDSLDRFHRSVN
jgi:ABC-type antimicrobial peptide transport system permease subunit